MNMVHKWTKEEDRLLLRYALQGIKRPELAKKIGRSIRAIEHRLAEKHRDYRVRIQPKRHPKKPRTQYLDCMPNPFKNIAGFNCNFYRTI